MSPSRAAAAKDGGEPSESPGSPYAAPPAKAQKTMAVIEEGGGGGASHNILGNLGSNLWSWAGMGGSVAVPPPASHTLPLPLPFSSMQLGGGGGGGGGGGSKEGRSNLCNSCACRGVVRCSSEHYHKGGKPHCEIKPQLADGELVAWQNECKAKMGLGGKKNFSLPDYIRWLKVKKSADLEKFRISDMAREMVFKFRWF